MSMSTTISGSERRHAWASWLAWGLWALCVVLGSISIALAFLVHGAGDGVTPLPLFPRLLMYVPGIVAAATVGALIAMRQPRNSVSWLFLASSIASSVGSFAEAYWRLALLVQPGAWPGGVLMLWVSTRPYILKAALDIERDTQA